MAVCTWLVLTAGWLFVWMLSYAGPNSQDERGQLIGLTSTEELAVIGGPIVGLVLMIAAIEVPLRRSPRSTVRCLGALGLGTAVLLYLGLETWNPTADVTRVGAVIAVTGAVLGGIVLTLATRGLSDVPRGRRTT